jgi:hypothetical protein
VNSRTRRVPTRDIVIKVLSGGLEANQTTKNHPTRRKEVAKVLILGYIPDANGPTVDARDQYIRAVVDEVIVDYFLQCTGCVKAQSFDSIGPSDAPNAVTSHGRVASHRLLN